MTEKAAVKREDDLTQRLKALDTCALSDALDRFGIDGQPLGISPLHRSFRCVGRAFTVQMLPRGVSGKPIGDYIDDVQAGEVVVIDNGGRLDATVWGELLSTVARRNGVAGTVIDGVCRDVARSLELGYPIYSRGHTMRTGKDRVSAEAFGRPIQLAGLRVEQADWIVADADGVVVIPKTLVDEIVTAAEEISAAEDNIRAAVLKGVPLLEIRTRLQYHRLQSQRTFSPESGVAFAHDLDD